MKTIMYMIIACLTIIAFNLFMAISTIDNNYSPKYAERIAQFAIVLVPLVIIFLAGSLGKAIKKKIHE